jgi:hypothetical protein
MFFSSVNYYTKPNKRITLEFSETKNYVKKTPEFPASMCENKNKSIIKGVVGSVSSVAPCEN